MRPTQESKDNAAATFLGVLFAQSEKDGVSEVAAPCRSLPIVSTAYLCWSSRMQTLDQHGCN